MSNANPIRSRVRVLQLGNPMGLYGAERWILALLRHLDGSRVESLVGVVFDEPNQDAPLCEVAKSRGFAVRTVQALGKVNWQAATRLRKLLVNEKIDVLHTHGYKTDLIGLLATRGTACKIVTTPHGWSAKDAGLKLRLYEALDRAALPFFDAVVPLSEALFDELRSIPGLGAKLHLVRNGVDIEEIDAVATLDPLMTQWKAAGDLVIGYIGQLIPRKGLDTLLRAFARLRMAGKRLVMIGEGPQRGELEALAASLGVREQVAFLGFRNDRLAFLKGFDLFVLPSQLEGIPRCLMESMAANVPIVATDIPGCRDLVTHDQTGLLFPVGDADALARRIEDYLDEDRRARIRRAARALVTRDYSAQAMARSYQRLYGELFG